MSNDQTATVHSINRDATKTSDAADAAKTDNKTDDKKPKPKLTRILPTNRMTVDRQLLLLRAYTASYTQKNEAVSIRTVVSVAKMDRTATSLANAFLVDVGLLDKVGNGFIPTATTQAFNHAHEWNPETAPQKLAPLFQKHWAAQKLNPLLMLDSISEEQAIRELATDANAGPENRSQLRAILEFLEKTGVVRRQNDSYFKGNVVASRSENDAMDASASTPMSAASSQEQKDTGVSVAKEPPMRSTTTTTFNQMTAGAVQFSINVKVDMAEFAGWEGDRITAFFAGIAQVLAAKAKVEQDIDA